VFVLFFIIDFELHF